MRNNTFESTTNKKWKVTSGNGDLCYICGQRIVSGKGQSWGVDSEKNVMFHLTCNFKKQGV